MPAVAPRLHLQGGHASRPAGIPHDAAGNQAHEAPKSDGDRLPGHLPSQGGKLANVFVYIKSGLGKYAFDQPTDPVIISQKNCRYAPHVFGIRVGQPLTILNDDPTLHNIHALPKNNSEFNVGQPIQGMKMNETFTAPEVMVPFKCDVHGWMHAYAGVLDHPYFAVTAADGTFSLKGCRRARTRSKRGTRSPARRRKASRSARRKPGPWRSRSRTTPRVARRHQAIISSGRGTHLAASKSRR